MVFLSNIHELRRNQLIYWYTGKTAIKIQLVGRQNNFFSSQFLGLTFWKEKISFLSEQRRKTSEYARQYA